jgi:hypothetical protein
MPEDSPENGAGGDVTDTIREGIINIIYYII